MKCLPNGLLLIAAIFQLNNLITFPLNENEEKNFVPFNPKS